MFDYHKVFKLQPGATKAEIRRAYKKFAFRFHPDRNKKHGDLFLLINEAYQVLMKNFQQTKKPRQAKKSKAAATTIRTSAPNSAERKKHKVNHNLDFVMAKLKKVKYSANLYVISNDPKVTIKAEQCRVCDGYGFYENIRHQLKKCPKCRGTGRNKGADEDDEF